MSTSEPGRARSTSLDRHASRTLRGERYTGLYDEPLRIAEAGGSAPSQARRDSSSLAFEVSTHLLAKMLITHFSCTLLMRLCMAPRRRVTCPHTLKSGAAAVHFMSMHRSMCFLSANCCLGKSSPTHRLLHSIYAAVSNFKVPSEVTAAELAWCPPEQLAMLPAGTLYNKPNKSYA